MYVPVLNRPLSIHMFPIPSSGLHRQCGYYSLRISYNLSELSFSKKNIVISTYLFFLT